MVSNFNLNNEIKLGVDFLWIHDTNRRHRITKMTIAILTNTNCLIKLFKSKCQNELKKKLISKLKKKDKHLSFCVMNEQYIYEPTYETYYDDTDEDRTNKINENFDNNVNSNSAGKKYYYATNEDVYYYYPEDSHKTRSHNKQNQTYPYYIVPVLYVPKKLIASSPQNVPHDNYTDVIDLHHEAKHFQSVINNKTCGHTKKCVLKSHKGTQYNFSDTLKSSLNENYGNIYDCEFEYTSNEPSRNYLTKANRVSYKNSNCGIIEKKFYENGDLSKKKCGNVSLIKLICKSIFKIFGIFKNTLLIFMNSLMFL